MASPEHNGRRHMDFVARGAIMTTITALVVTAGIGTVWKLFIN
jgi:hypothetical protein